MTVLLLFISELKTLKNRTSLPFSSSLLLSDCSLVQFDQVCAWRFMISGAVLWGSLAPPAPLLRSRT